MLSQKESEKKNRMFEWERKRGGKEKRAGCIKIKEGKRKRLMECKKRRETRENKDER